MSNVSDLSEIFGQPKTIADKLPRLKQKVVDSLCSTEVIEEAKQIAHWCQQEDIHIVPLHSENYPKQLSLCPDAPLLLYVKGNMSVLHNRDAISVVGTRNITKYGADTTNRLIDELGQALPNITIVSGLAFGVDIASHRTALDKGLTTVAVLAHGLDRVYPYQHADDARRIIEQKGALVSEYPPKTKPERFNFVTRNRIIAGLTKGTLVVEAGLKSGSLITADYAAGYDREVFAVPGKIDDKYSEGCNDIIRRYKAVLVTNAKQILSYMGMSVCDNVIVQSISFDDEQLPDNPIVKIISEHQPIQLNDIINISKLDMSQVSNMLFDLELDGFVEAMPGGLYIISKR